MKAAAFEYSRPRDLDEACALLAAEDGAYSWPELDEFNWALDWFDVIAAEHPDRTALRIVTSRAGNGPDGAGLDGAGPGGAGPGGDHGTRISYQEMARRSDQVACWLRDMGVQRGDRLLLMLGNIAPLWEVILAAMKLGAVIVPTSTLLGPADLADRIERGDVRHVVTESAHVPKFREVPGDWTRIAVEPTVGGATEVQGSAGSTATPAPGAWRPYADSYGASRDFTPVA